MTGGSAAAPAWHVVLDANVLLQAPIRDTILRLAEFEVVSVYWSEDVLAEGARNFAAVTGAHDAERRATRLFAALDAAFSGSTLGGYQAMLADLPIEPHDRHVLACAILVGATHIVTHNQRHFPLEALAPWSIDVWSPDQLLCAIFAHYAELRLAVLRAQGEALRPRRSLHMPLVGLEQAVPQFAQLVRHYLVR